MSARSGDQSVSVRWPRKEKGFSCTGSPSSRETPSPTTRPEEPLAGSSEGGKDANSRLLCSVGPPSPPIQHDALWRRLQDTAAMLGVTLPNPFTLEGGARSEQLWGIGWRERQKQVLSTCSFLALTPPLLCSQRLRTARQVTAPSLKDQVLLDQTAHSVLVCICSGLRTASYGTGGPEGRALGTLTNTCPQPSSLEQFN